MVNKSLVTLVDETAKLESALIESNGEVTEEIEKMLEIKDIQLPEKVDNYALMIDRMDMLATFYKQKADVFIKLNKLANQVADRCHTNLKNAMLKMETTELNGFDIRYKLVNSNHACVIDDESKLDGAYKISEVVTKVDKKRLVEDLKLGVPVEGAHLEQGQSLRKYVNGPTRKATNGKE